MEPTTTLLLSLFVVALAFGAGAQFSRLCLLGGLRDGFGQRNYGRLAVYLVTIAVALLGAALVQSLAGVDFNNTKPPFRNPQFAWGRYIIGGFVFGVGMVLARGCPLRHMVRLGQGHLPSLTILIVVALTTYVMTRTSVYADWFLPWVGGMSIDLTRFGIAHQDLASLLGGGGNLNLVLSLIIGAGLLLFAVRYLRNLGGWLGAAMVGAMVAAAYYLTGGPLGKAALEASELMDTPPEGLGTQSFSFAAPLGDVVHYLSLGGASVALTFGVVAVVGVLLGGFVSTLIRREFSFQGFGNLHETSINLLGAILLGVGSVLAMGCTVGHGFSGIATLALGSIVAMLAIVAGSWSMLKLETQWGQESPASCG